MIIIMIIFWDINRSPDPGQKLDLLIVYKKKENLLNIRLWRHGGPQSENQRKWKESHVFWLFQRSEKSYGIYKDDGDTNRNLYSWNDPERFSKEVRRYGNQRMNRDHQIYSILMIT